MNSELEKALEKAYRIFSLYPRPQKGNGCPCCVSGSDESNLHAAPLRNLNAENLGRFTFKAMTTWGSVEDFKYYLPRIFELMIAGDEVCDEQVFLNKLPYGNFKDWPKEEQEIVNELILLWWTEIVNTRTRLYSMDFAHFYSFLGEMKMMLDVWNLDFATQGFRNFVDFIYSYANDIVMEKKLDHLELNENDRVILTDFIFEKAEKLPEAWMRIEKADPDFAADIAIAYDTVTVLKKFRYV